MRTESTEMLAFIMPSTVYKNPNSNIAIKQFSEFSIPTSTRLSRATLSSQPKGSLQAEFALLSTFYPITCAYSLELNDIHP
jgi:hypothetical protein